ncbi:AMP-binding protein [Sphingomonas sp. PAMC 26617]|uniref:AMP-binding protein n=1 Tax=Sphingomonas sp. PAMC 26617 TaxID=1112216 RepID=UPI00028A2184|nr:AMP-binding protein [Sphingomonas sp. PAMC 26617]
MTTAIPREALRRIVTCLVTAETNLTRADTRRGGAEDPAAWADDRLWSVGSVPLDSLETVNAGAALYEMFGLEALQHDATRGPPTTVGAWLDDIARFLRGEDASLTVMTSGSTGRPKPCVHAIRDLQAEARHFGAMLPDVRRVIALVPAHHIYGLIWTALLPATLDVPVVAATAMTLPPLEQGDLIVAVPDHWRALARARRSWPAGVAGVSAGAPLDDALAETLLDAGLDRLLVVYGSSETGGVAVRALPDAGYTLLPRWRFAETTGPDAAVIRDRHGNETVLPDILDVAADGRFAVIGRRDGAVQVGGVNVWPEQVADVLRQCPGIADAAVRLGDQHRLKAFVVPVHSEDQNALLDRLIPYVRRFLLPEQRPTSYALGSVLPRTALGKPCDWT